MGRHKSRRFDGRLVGGDRGGDRLGDDGRLREMDKKYGDDKDETEGKAKIPRGPPARTSGCCHCAWKLAKFG
eukprot:CAMPEP_0118662656 /NCGR_PEP_ID=MMETSP0785-20121206/16950_1 /TAXON_ID=91992 /ORGANISM="Bolidomonas pacifica, Strain CCMP 1866" /LENGTH=71 /DNA_ID=CAMNT_0006556219 /DNA_START=175 /DNA_END=386 /DNA_ORIENTATION=+